MKFVLNLFKKSKSFKKIIPQINQGNRKSSQNHADNLTFNIPVKNENHRGEQRIMSS